MEPSQQEAPPWNSIAAGSSTTFIWWCATSRRAGASTARCSRCLASRWAARPRIISGRTSCSSPAPAAAWRRRDDFMAGSYQLHAGADPLAPNQERRDQLLQIPARAELDLVEVAAGLALGLGKLVEILRQLAPDLGAAGVVLDGKAVAEG